MTGQETAPKLDRGKNPLFLEWHILRRNQSDFVSYFKHSCTYTGEVGVIRSQVDEVIGFRSIIVENPEA